MITNILLGMFFAPFIMVVAYITIKVMCQVLITLYSDMLGVIGFDNLRSSIIRKFL